MRKKLLTYLIAVISLVAISSLSSCNDTTPKDTLSVKPSALTFESTDTRLKEIEITKTASTFSATCPETWVRITQENRKIIVSVNEYTAAEATANGNKERLATITITSGTADKVEVTVTQLMPGQNLAISPTELTFEADQTDPVDVAVATNSSSYDATCPESWVIINKESSKFSVSVQEYTDAQAWSNGRKDRTATITVTSGTNLPISLVVTQKPYPVKISCYPAEIQLIMGELSQSVQITTNASDVTASVSSEYPWIKNVVLNGNTLTFNVDKLMAGEINSREGYIDLNSTQAEPYRLKITQPAETLIDLAGKWRMTGRTWRNNTYSDYFDIEVSIVRFGETVNEWYVSGIESNNFGGVLGIVITSDENNGLYFVQGKDTGKDLIMPGMGISCRFYNIATYINEDLTSTKTYPADGTSIGLTLHPGFNKITFPWRGVRESDGQTFDMVFGLGYKANGTGTLYQEATIKDIVLNRVVL